MRSSMRWRGMGFGPVLMLAMVGCGRDAPQVADATPQEVLNRAAERMDAVESFAFLMEHENGFTPIAGGLAMERAEGRIAERNRMQADVRARAGALAVDLGIVAIADSSWMTNPFTGAWGPGTFDVSALFDPATGLTALLRGLTNPAIAGTESVTGVRAQKLEATVDSGELSALIPGVAAGSPLAVRVWIGAEDPVLLRAAIAGALAEGESPDLLRRITLSGFGESFTIESPLGGGAQP